MSYVFDYMQYALRELSGDAAIKRGLAEAIDQLHEISHQAEDALNHDRTLRLLVSKLEKLVEAKHTEEQQEPKEAANDPT